MSKVPEGVETATAEGRDLAGAVATVAEALGVKPHQIKHTIDMSHFRTEDGRSVPRDTVKIIGWVNPDAPEEAPKAEARPPRERRDDGEREERPRRDREDRPPRSRDREDRPRRDDDRPRRDDDRARRDDDRPRRDDDRPRREARRGAEEGTNEASEFAQAWFATLLQHLDVTGTVEATGSTERIHVRIVPTDKAGRLIGRRGSTLGAIRHLLGLALERFGTFMIDVDVDDERGGERAERPERAERDERKGRGRDRDDRGARGGRGGRGGRDRDDRGGRGGRDRDDRERSAYPEDKLRALARRAAEKAVETGKTITINLELNSYDRRIVHMEVSEIEGVGTRSQEKGDKKVVQVYPE